VERRRAAARVAQARAETEFGLGGIAGATGSPPPAKSRAPSAPTKPNRSVTAAENEFAP
jgi:hypothetical protein